MIRWLEVSGRHVILRPNQQGREYPLVPVGPRRSRLLVHHRPGRLVLEPVQRRLDRSTDIPDRSNPAGATSRAPRAEAASARLVVQRSDRPLEQAGQATGRRDCATVPGPRPRPAGDRRQDRMASQVPDVVGDHRTHPERRPLLGTHRSRSAAIRTRNAARSSPWSWTARAPASAARVERSRASLPARLAAISVWRAIGLEQLAGQAGLAPCDPALPVDLDQLRSANPARRTTRPSWPARAEPLRVSSARAPRVSHSSPRMTSARIQPSGPASAGVRNPGHEVDRPRPDLRKCTQPPRHRPARAGPPAQVHGAPPASPPRKRASRPRRSDQGSAV